MSLASHVAPHGVVDLTIGTLTTRRLRSDHDIDEHLTALKSACRQTRRYREALPVLHRIATLNPGRRHEMAAEIALVHWHLGERDLAVAALVCAVKEQRSLPAWKRSLAFALVAEVAATVIGRRELAVDCAQLGRSSATPAPRRARATTTARAAKPVAAKPVATKASRRGERPAAGAPAAGALATGALATGAPATVPSVGRRRAKGPVRQLSVLTPAGGSHPAEVAPTKSTRPLLTVVGGTAA